RSAQRGQLSRALELRDLLRCRSLWRTQALPGSKAVAVIFINSELFELGLPSGRRQADPGQLHRRIRPSPVVVMIMPDENAELVLVEAGERGHIGPVSHATPHDFIERDRAVALHLEALAGHFAEHAEDVEHGLVDAVAGQGAEAGEVRLV